MINTIVGIRIKEKKRQHKRSMLSHELAQESTIQITKTAWPQAAAAARQYKDACMHSTAYPREQEGNIVE